MAVNVRMTINNITMSDKVVENHRAPWSLFRCDYAKRISVRGCLSAHRSRIDLNCRKQWFPVVDSPPSFERVCAIFFNFDLGPRAVALA